MEMDMADSSLYHVYTAASEEERRHLQFRDSLLSHPERVRGCAALKQGWDR